MRTALMVLALLAAPAFAGQDVWKWVDDKGVTHYADRPVPGAQRVEISAGSRTDSAPPAPSYSSNAPARNPAPATRYQDFAISRPGNQETIPNSAGTVEVQIQLQPGLQRGHSISLYMDGRLIDGFPPQALQYTLADVPRGEHSLTATVQDRNGNRIQETQPVQFFVRQTSIAQPPVGPTLRKQPPKPR